MNDRFRFRIWNPDLQSYDDNRDYNVAILVNQDFGLVLNPYRDNIIEMCTGLKDKNGKLIYEGDVVKCDRDFDLDGRVNLTKEVIFTDGTFTLANIDPKNRDFCYINRFHNIEIIGNIHESNKLWIHYELEQKDVK